MFLNSRRAGGRRSKDGVEHVPVRGGGTFFLLRCLHSTHPDRVKLTTQAVHRAVRAALAEDLGSGDVTSQATVPARATFTVIMRAREPLVAAGLVFAEAAFRQLSASVQCKPLARDGQHVKPGAGLLRITAPNAWR
jgi:hypothetical protein